MANLGPTTQAENNSLEQKGALLFHKGISRWWSVFNYLKISVSMWI